MGPWSPRPYNGVWFNLNIYGQKGNGKWVQTYITSVSGNTPAGTPTTDISGNYSYSSSTWFYDDPAAFTGQDKIWVAQTSYIIPGQPGAAFTFQWGYQSYANGGVSYIQPVAVVPWPSQQQLIQANQ